MRLLKLGINCFNLIFRVNYANWANIEALILVVMGFWCQSNVRWSLWRLGNLIETHWYKILKVRKIGSVTKLIGFEVTVILYTCKTLGWDLLGHEWAFGALLSKLPWTLISTQTIKTHTYHSADSSMSGCQGTSLLAIIILLPVCQCLVGIGMLIVIEVFAIRTHK